MCASARFLSRRRKLARPTFSPRHLHADQARLAAISFFPPPLTTARFWPPSTRALILLRTYCSTFLTGWPRASRTTGRRRREQQGGGAEINGEDRGFAAASATRLRATNAVGAAGRQRGGVAHHGECQARGSTTPARPPTPPTGATRHRCHPHGPAIAHPRGGRQKRRACRTAVRRRGARTRDRRGLSTKAPAACRAARRLSSPFSERRAGPRTQDITAEGLSTSLRAGADGHTVAGREGASHLAEGRPTPRRPSRARD